MPYKILVPTDGSEPSKRAAIFAAELAKGIPGATITVLTVITLPRSLAGRQFYWRLKEQPGDLQKEIGALFREEAEQVVGAVARLLRERGVEPEVMVREGDPAEEIIRCAAEGGFDHVVLGARGFGMLSLLVGNVAHKVIQLATIPVTIVR